MIPSRIRPSALLAMVLLLTAGAVPVAAQESGPGINTEDLLRDALMFTVDMEVSTSDGLEEIWSTGVEKITIPGRAVEVDLEGLNSRLKVNFTPYPAENGTLLLVARSEIWVEGEYSSALTSLPIAYRDEVYYYPLGRAGNGREDSPVEIRMIINVVPYLDTLSADERAAMESVFDSSAQFDLSGEDD